jgi:hypothetical protein
VNIQSSLQKVVQYTQPRKDLAKGIDTTGDEVVVDQVGNAVPRRAGPGILAGGIQGYLLDGISGAAGGVIGSAAGSAVGKKNMLAGAATGAAVGALTSTALTAGLAAAFGGQPGSLMFAAVSGGLAGLSGTLASAPGGVGVMSGGIQGFVGNRMSGMAAGSVGGYVGLEVGERTGSTSLALLAGTASGALTGAGATFGLLSLAGGQSHPALIVGSAVLGGMAGFAGTIGGSLRSAPKDGVYGGMATGMAAGAITGNPILGLSTAAAAGFAARAESKVGQIILGVGAGAVSGAISGGLLGPANILTGAIAGALAAPAGAVLGTASRQVMRNAQIDLIEGINKKFVDPYLEKHTLTHAQKVMVGAAAGGLALGTTGMIAGWKGVAVMGSLGAAAGAFHWDRVIKKAQQNKKAALNADTYSRPHGMFANVVAAQAEIAAAKS